MLKSIKQILSSKSLTKKISFSLAIVLLVRILAQISIPGADQAAIKNLFANNELLGLFSLLTGGGAENFSIILLGLSPYINSSIIIQLLTVIFPKLENLSKEGEQGRRKLNQYTRLLTIPLAFIQSYGMILLMNSQVQIIANVNNPEVIIPIMITVTAGSILMMWLGEQISEKGIGNGISVLIFTGIISALPQRIGQDFSLIQESNERLIPFLGSILLTLIFTIIVIIVTEAERRIPVIYTSRGKSNAIKSNLPIRINQAGMIPIIFSVSVVSFPSIISQFLQNSNNATLQKIADFLTNNFAQNSLPYLILYFLLILAFTFFYVSITFNPEQVAENIQKRGGYIPGVRPGKQTAEYIKKVSNHLNLFGGLFIGLIAITPNIIQYLATLLNFGTFDAFISGAGLIIVVGVVLELIRQVNSQLVMQDYNNI